MKTMIRNKAFRSVCLLIVGMLLVWCSDEAPKWLVQGVGVLLVIPGVVSLLSLLRKDKTRRELLLYPVVGVVTVVFGILLIFWPSFFVRASMFVLAALLIILGAHQVYSRWRMQKMGIEINGATFLLPVLIIGAGIFVLVYKELAAALPFILLGAAYIVYSLFELWSVISLVKYQKLHPETAAPEVVESLPEAPAAESDAEAVEAEVEEIEAEVVDEESDREKDKDEEAFSDAIEEYHSYGSDDVEKD